MPQGSNIQFTTSVPQFGYASPDAFGGGLGSGLRDLGSGVSSGAGSLLEANRVELSGLRRKQEDIQRKQVELQQRERRRLAIQMRADVLRQSEAMLQAGTEAEVEEHFNSLMDNYQSEYFTEERMEREPELGLLQEEFTQDLALARDSAKYEVGRKREVSALIESSQSTMKEFLTAETPDPITFVNRMRAVAEDAESAELPQVRKAAASDAKSALVKVARGLNRGGLSSLPAGVQDVEELPEYLQNLERQYAAAFPGEVLDLSSYIPDIGAVQSKLRVSSARETADLVSGSFDNYLTKSESTATPDFLERVVEDLAVLSEQAPGDTAKIENLTQHHTRAYFHNLMKRHKAGATALSPALTGYASQVTLFSWEDYKRKNPVAKKAEGRVALAMKSGFVQAREEFANWVTAAEKEVVTTGQPHKAVRVLDPGAENLLQTNLSTMLSEVDSFGTREPRIASFQAAAREYQRVVETTLGELDMSVYQDRLSSNMLPWEVFDKAYRNTGGESRFTFMENMWAALGDTTFQNFQAKVLAGEVDVSEELWFHTALTNPELGEVPGRVRGVLHRMVNLSGTEAVPIQEEVLRLARNTANDYLAHVGDVDRRDALTEVLARTYQRAENEAQGASSAQRAMNQALSEAFFPATLHAQSAPALAQFGSDGRSLLAPDGMFTDVEDFQETFGAVTEQLSLHVAQLTDADVLKSVSYPGVELDPREMGTLERIVKGVPLVTLGSLQYNAFLGFRSWVNDTYLGPREYDARESTKALVEFPDLVRETNFPEMLRGFEPELLENMDEGDEAIVRRTYLEYHNKGAIFWKKINKSWELHIINPDMLSLMSQAEARATDSKPIRDSAGNPIAVPDAQMNVLLERSKQPVAARIEAMKANAIAGVEKLIDPNYNPDPLY